MSITKTYLYIFDPLKPHFYTEKMRFTGVYIISINSTQKHILWVLVRTPWPVLSRNMKNIRTFIWKLSIVKWWNFPYTVDSRYLEIKGTLWNTSRYPFFDISDLWNWGKQLIEQPPLTEWIFNLTLKLEIYWKCCGKEEKLLFSTIFCCLLVDLCVKTGTRFSLRDKRLFKISEFEITRVDCIWIGVFL